MKDLVRNCKGKTVRNEKREVILEEVKDSEGCGRKKSWHDLRYFPGRTKKNNGKPWSEQPAYWPRNGPGTCTI
jgi:hypothetical protein